MGTDKKGMTIRLTDGGWDALDAIVEAIREVEGGATRTSVLERLVREKARGMGVWGAPPGENGKP